MLFPALLPGIFHFLTTFQGHFLLTWRVLLTLMVATFQINLKLILVSGKTKEFHFVPSDSVAYITQYVYDNWPAGGLLVFFAYHVCLLCVFMCV